MQVKLSFLGATQNVTGSRFLIEINGQKVLVDCGLYQERKLIDRNWDKFPVPANSINAVLLTHAHLDHCGLIPKLVKEGFRGRILCTAPTAEIARIILLDSAKLQEEDAEFKRKRHRKEGRRGPHPVKPLYTAADAELCWPRFSPVGYNRRVKVTKNIQATFHDAGHVFGSSCISVHININGDKRTLLFSGDVGRHDKPIIGDPDELKYADYVLMEATYGDRLHKETEDVREKLASVINDTLDTGGNIVIPSFALERSQELLYHINELMIEDRIPELPVFLDSPMAIAITEVFRNHPELFDEAMARRVAKSQSPFDFDTLKMTESKRGSKAINRIKGTCIIIAGSGMCTGGRIKHHLVNNIAREESTILFVGYQAEGTLGRYILEGHKDVRILGRMLQAKARIASVNGFSAHADRDELYEWISGLREPPRHVFVVHGETGPSEHFRDFLEKKTGWSVSVPRYQEQVVLN